MKIKAKTFGLFAIAFAALFANAGEKVVDWVELYGGVTKDIIGSGTYEDGVAYYSDYKFQANLSIVDERFKLVVTSVNNGGWIYNSFTFTNACNVTFGEAQQIVVPYKYVSTGTGEVGQHFRLIIGTSAGKKYFGVISQETIVKDEESFLTFNFSEAYVAYPTDYATVKDSQITVMRLYPFNTGDSITTSETTSSGGKSNFVANDELYIGAFTSKWTDVTGYTASFNSNGGNPVPDIRTGEDGAITFPSATRDDYTFMGWYRDGYKFDAGAEGVLAMDAEFAAAWRKTDPLPGLSSTPIDYRKELDAFKSYGSCCEVLTGNTISYEPLTDVCTCVRENVFELDAEHIDRGSYTNFVLVGKGGNSGNNSPELILPVVGLTVKDIHDVKVRYRTTSAALAGLTMTLKYWIGSKQYDVTSIDTMQISEDDEFRTVKFKVAATLGESNYEKLKDSTITAWRLHPYVGSTMPFKKGVSLELGRLILDAEHSDGLMMIVR